MSAREFLAWLGAAAGAVCTLLVFIALVLFPPGPLDDYGEPTFEWTFDRIVFPDDTSMTVEAAAAMVDSSQWGAFARLVVREGGRFERMTCESWEATDEELTRCTPTRIRWQEAITASVSPRA